MIDYAALKTELLTDPTGLGYSTSVTKGDDVTTTAVLNQIRAGIQVTRDLIPAYEVFDAIDPAEWAALSAQEKQRIQIILSLGTVMMTGTNTRNAFQAAFAAGTATRTALVALRTRAGSRAEQLFNQSVGVSDVAKALRG